MLKIENINIIYNRNIIIESKLIIPDNSLVVIKGISGSGKTSLIRTILLEEKTFDKYVINGSEIEDNNIDEIKKSCFSLMDQQNTFIEELSVAQHFNLIGDLYNNKDTELIKKLEVDNILDKYPNQLSGGEKTRVSLALCILKNTPVIVMDEPTSSLDSYYSSIVVEILEKLSDEHMLIVASHDQSIFDKADYIYEINEQHLNLISGEIVNEDNIERDIIKKESKLRLSKYMLEMKKYNFVSNLIMMILISLSISIASVGIYFGIAQMSDSYASLEDIYNNEVNIYKPVFADTESYYSGAGNENHFTQEEYEEIKNIKGIKEIYPHIELSYQGIHYPIDDPQRMAGSSSNYYFSLYNQDRLIKTVKLNESDNNDDMTGSRDIVAVSYDEKGNYDDDIEIKYNNNGVYLSKELAVMFGLDNIDKETEISFSLLVPLYKESGDMEIALEDLIEYVPGYPTLCKTVDVRLPVAGILDGMDMGSWSRSTSLALFIPLNYYQEMINSNLPATIDTYYYIEEIEGFKRAINENDTILETVTAVPWMPDTYTLKLDSIENYRDILTELESKGFAVMTNFSHLDVIDDYAYNISGTFITFSVAILIILSIVNFVLKFVNRNCDQSIMQYFKKIGFSGKENRKILSLRYRINFYLITGISILIVIIYYVYAYITTNYLAPFKFEYILIIIVLSFVIEYVFPSIFIRGAKK